MQVDLRLFASIRDRAGFERKSIELSESSSVGELLDYLASLHPSVAPALPSALVAVNHQYAFADDPLHDGDEVAVFPPVSGGSGENETGYHDYFAVTSHLLDLNMVARTITRPETGAVCIFSGSVRGQSIGPKGQQTTDRLVYEAYEPMAEKTLRQIAGEIRARFPGVQGIAIVQRVGTLTVGETTILVGCSSSHRDDGCFEAARYGIDRVKEIVPVWKKEIGTDRETWIEGHYLPVMVDRLQPTHPARRNKKSPNDHSFMYECSVCGSRNDLGSRQSRCDCSGIFRIVGDPVFDPSSIVAGDHSIWRYRHKLVPQGISPITLGEGWTPLVSLPDASGNVLAKLESLNPTGSFKDRGAALLISVQAYLNRTSVHDDTSGNAGVSLAAYSARAGIIAKIFVPETTSGGKLALIRAFGAELHSVQGARSAASQAAIGASRDDDSYYASHVLNPFSIMANQSIAYEIWEQLGKNLPDAVIVPAGHGTQLLGLAKGFDELVQVGAAHKAPKLYAVQAEACSPLVTQFADEQLTAHDSSSVTTIAEGIRITEPIRANEVVDAVRNSRGEILAVSESEIVDGLRNLLSQGILVEPTSAVVWPAIQRVVAKLGTEALIVVSITGSGSKIHDLANFIGTQALAVPSVSA